VSACKIPADLLNIGQFFISVGSDFPMVQANFSAERVLGVNVELAGGGVGGHVMDGRVGLLRMRMPWTVTRVAEA
jgi:hypothetical protein